MCVFGTLFIVLALSYVIKAIREIKIENLIILFKINIQYLNIYLFYLEQTSSTYKNIANTYLKEEFYN